MTRPPIPDRIPGLRQRRRSDGSWRVWWEPSAMARAAGHQPVDLSADKPGWSVREATRLNAAVARKRSGRSAGSGSARSLAGLADAYRRSSRYRDSYDYFLRKIVDKWGDVPVADFSKPVIWTWYETQAREAGPTMAARLVSTMSVLMSYAELIGWRAENSNPCMKLGVKANTPRDRFASWAEYDALIAAADRLDMPAMSCAIALATFTSQRQTDVVAARIDGFRDVTLPASGGNATVFTWDLVRSKRGNAGLVPVHPEAAPRVRALIGAACAGQEALLCDHATGRALSGDLFRKRWSTIRTQAACTCPSVTSLQFRDLRRTFGVWAEEGGAGRADIAAVLGNTLDRNPRLSQTYLPPQFHAAARAVEAVRRPDDEDENG